MYISRLIFRLNSARRPNLFVFSGLKMSSGTFFVWLNCENREEEFFDEAWRVQNEKVWLFLCSDRK